MQLYKCLNCFLKTHNKQLNQYYLFFFFYKKKKGFKKWFGFGSGWVAGRVTGQPVFLRDKKIGFGLGIFWVGSGQVSLENSDPFCHV